MYIYNGHVVATENGSFNNLESRRQQYTVRRILGVESFPVRLQFHTQISQLCQGVSRANLHTKIMVYDIYMYNNYQ